MTGKKKSFTQRACEASEACKDLLDSIVNKQEHILQLQTKKSLLACFKNNLGLIMALIAIAGLVFLNIQTQTALGTFEFNVNAYNEAKEEEARIEKIGNIEDINAVINELQYNLDTITGYISNRADYYKEENGEPIAVGKIIQGNLSVDNITEFLKNPPIAGEYLLEGLWAIKGTSIQVNDKIFDGRMLVYSASLVCGKENTLKCIGASQKDIIEKLEIYMKPTLNKAIPLLEEEKRKLEEELSAIKKSPPPGGT